ncbi:kinesin-like protein KIF24 [Protopterus annectens]|uniref:kinesin-like protein KIF24 n=1 Tax=Protopterus annectens TaxID=7888 RepID=UPI001CF9FAD2|nr:kinesin-like protein KIF24 [Protopterus annectens]
MKMASCLYECLCEAGLEQYYPSFTAMGLLRAQELAKLTMNDYSRLGIADMHDRIRLFQLIQIIKAVQDEETKGVQNVKPVHTPADFTYIYLSTNKSGPRRQLDFESEFEKTDRIITSSKNEFCEPSDVDCFTYAKNGKLPGQILPSDPHNKRRESKEPNKANHAWTQKETPCQTLDLPNTNSWTADNGFLHIQRILQASGYNYGVPHSSTRQISEKNSYTESDKIRVCVRKRPLRLREQRHGEEDVVTVEDKKSLIIHENKEAVDLTQYVLQHVFYFDEVFSEACSNQDVYMKTAHPLIHHIFNGGKATCFAYGQTGAGKTHTMIGTRQNPGLYALAAKDIFRHLQFAQSGRVQYVWISFYEIYCGQLYDLLNGKKRLFAREDGNHIVQIVGLREVQVDSVNFLLEVILRGSKERSTGASGVNSDSSRSHAVIQIQIKDLGGRGLGRISFIDLAGSERAADAKESDKQTKMEGAEINQSLLALKECIRALDQEHAHTPFRQSKLTQVLKDSFIGNSKTCMIANVSPSNFATEHTLNTLRYADRVKELKMGIKCSSTAKGQCVRSPSPKRNKSVASFVQREKSVPKKVKLTLHPPLTAPSSVRHKSTAAVFHPSNVPLSSTPKASAKSDIALESPCYTWSKHTTPVKGFMKVGLSEKLQNSTTEHQSFNWEDENTVILKSEATKSKQCSKSAKSRQGEYENRQEQTSRNQKVQAVLPLQKELALKDVCCNSTAVVQYYPYERTETIQSHVNKLPCGNVKSSTDVLSQQKEKERHLHLYHQQLQQIVHPAVLQQKLTYQPLQNLFRKYKTKECSVKNDDQCPYVCNMPCKNDREAEDTDNSDAYSIDSISCFQNQRKVQENNQGVFSKASFFLHNSEVGTGEAHNRVTEHSIGSSKKQEHSLSWNDYPKCNELCKKKEDNTLHENCWTTEERCTVSSSLNSNSLSNKQDFPKSFNFSEVQINDISLVQKQNNFASDEQNNHGINQRFLQNEYGVSFFHEVNLDSTELKQDVRTPSASIPKTKKDQYFLLQNELKKDAQHSGGLNWGTTDLSGESVSGQMEPLTVSLLTSDKTAVSDDVLLDQSHQMCRDEQTLDSRITNFDSQFTKQVTNSLNSNISALDYKPSFEESEIGNQEQNKIYLQVPSERTSDFYKNSAVIDKPVNDVDWSVSGSPSSFNQELSNPLLERDKLLVSLTVHTSEISSKDSSNSVFLSDSKYREMSYKDKLYDPDTEDNHLNSLLSAPVETHSEVHLANAYSTEEKVEKNDADTYYPNSEMIEKNASMNKPNICVNSADTQTVSDSGHLEIVQLLGQNSALQSKPNFSK